ncbi:MAG: hypothetical protein H0U64_03430 [Gemmatimonadaceae bacterium]|nr:hypothetical protein [Gemmatimonadaceae bacterium]
MVTGATGAVAQGAINRHCSGELPGMHGFSGVSIPAIVSIAGADEPEEMHDKPLELSSDPVTSEKLASRNGNLRFNRIINLISVPLHTKGAASQIAQKAQKRGEEVDASADTCVGGSALTPSLPDIREA